MSAGAGNYEYVTARVKARRAALFDEEDYQNLVRMGTGEIARFMEDSVYERDINALGASYSGVDLIEYALNANLARNFDDLLRWCDGLLYERVARYLRKFDSWNIKTLLRGVYGNTDPEIIEEHLIPAGELGDPLLGELVEFGTIEEVVEGLAETTFGEALAEAMDDYQDTGLLVPLENAVDRAFYEQLIDGVSGGDYATRRYLGFLRAEIDFRNVRNALRIARSGVEIDASEYFIEGGRLFDANEIRTLVGNPEELVAILGESTYGDELEAALDRFEEGKSLAEFENALDKALVSYSNHLSHVNPLSVSPVLAYVLAKEQEVRNVRAIARGREAGLSAEEIEQEFVIR